MNGTSLFGYYIGFKETALISHIPCLKKETSKWNAMIKLLMGCDTAFDGATTFCCTDVDRSRQKMMWTLSLLLASIERFDACNVIQLARISATVVLTLNACIVI